LAATIKARWVLTCLEMSKDVSTMPEEMAV
jgi:hypothetical protein